MRIPIGFWIFAILGIISNFVSGALLYMMLMMPAFAFFPYPFIAAVLFLLTLFIISIIGLFKLKKWGRNIFVTITTLLNVIVVSIFTILSLGSKSLYLLVPAVALTVCFFVSVLYFFRPSVKELFN
jgi:hypothetical protein